MTRLLRICTLVLMVLVLTPLLTGCFLSEDSEQTETVNDVGGLFHIKHSEAWSSMAQKGLVVIYGDEKLPESEKLDSLSIAVLISGEVVEEPAPETLKFIAEERSSNRGWTDATIGEVEEATIGDRDAYRLEVAGTDGLGVEFRGYYYLVRTSGHEVMVIAVAPARIWDGIEADVVTLTENEWYWHLPHSDESTDTAN